MNQFLFKTTLVLIKISITFQSFFQETTLVLIEKKNIKNVIIFYLLLPYRFGTLKLLPVLMKSTQKAPQFTFKITSVVQFWGAFRRLKDKIIVKLPSEGPSKFWEYSGWTFEGTSQKSHSKGHSNFLKLEVIWGDLLKRPVKRPPKLFSMDFESVLRGLIPEVQEGTSKGPSKFLLGK